MGWRLACHPETITWCRGRIGVRLADVEMSEKKSTGKPDDSPPERKGNPSDEGRGSEHDEVFTGEWFAGIGAGIKGVSRKLFDQVPPEIREKVAEAARTHGPGEAAVVVHAAALKARSLKAKLALKTLAGLLKLLDSKSPGK